MSHFSTDSLDDKPCSEAKRSHKRLFPGTLVWPLSNTGVLPARDSTDVKPGFHICVFCFPCTRKSASLEKTHLNSILQREYQDKVGCISSRDLRVLQRLLRVPFIHWHNPVEQPTFKGPHGKPRGPRALGFFVSEGRTGWLYNHPDWHSSAS